MAMYSTSGRLTSASSWLCTCTSSTFQTLLASDGR
jgi:hypothetical protein